MLLAYMELNPVPHVEGQLSLFLNKVTYELDLDVGAYVVYDSAGQPLQAFPFESDAAFLCRCFNGDDA